MSAFHPWSVAFATAALLAGVEPKAIAQSVAEQQRTSEASRARHEVCYAIAAGAAGLNLANCLSFESAPEPVFRAEVCNFLRETEQLPDFEFASHAQCLRDGFVR